MYKDEDEENVSRSPKFRSSLFIIGANILRVLFDESISIEEEELVVGVFVILELELPRHKSKT